MKSDDNDRVRWRGAVGAAMLGAGLLGSGAALAQTPSNDLPANTAPKSALARAFDYVGHNLYFRFGAGYLDYYGDSTRLKVENATGLAAQSFGPGESKIDDTGSSIGDKLFPSGTLGLYLPRTNHHLAVETTLSGPIQLDFQVSGRAARESLAPTALTGNGPGNTIPTGVPSTGRHIGTLKTLPPNISFVYRPFVHTRIQPYVGLGAMYLYTYDTTVDNPVLNAVSTPTLYLSKPVACTGKLGVDVNITRTFFVGAEAQYIGCAEIKAKLNDIVVNSPTLSPTFGPVKVGTISTEDHFRAVLYQLSMGVRFD